MISINQAMERVLEAPEEFFQRVIDLAGTGCDIVTCGSGFRIQPCPLCGHYDCCTFDSVMPVVHCFSAECNTSLNYWDFAMKMLKDPVKVKNIFEEVTGQRIEVGGNGNEIDRLTQIRNWAASFYHKQLLSDNKYLEYQLNTRKHTRDTLALFKVGKASSYGVLKAELKEMGFTEEEIKEAKVFIPEGLFVYPYFMEGNVIRFNAKNPFNIEDANNKTIAGYSTGSKMFYQSPAISYDSVIVVEGENDLLSVVESGSKSSVIASGGTLSKEQIEFLRRFKSIYLMFDNDSQGEKYAINVNQLLPEVKVFKVEYDLKCKDPDEYLKQSTNVLHIDELLRNAVPLENSSYIIRIENNTAMLVNRSYAIHFELKEIKSGNFKGNFFFFLDNALKDCSYGIYLDKVGKKYIEYIEPIRKAFENHYNANLEGAGAFELLSRYKFSAVKEKIIELVAQTLITDSNSDTIIKRISDSFGSSICEQVLIEINRLQNNNIDPNRTYELMPVSQAFDLTRKIGYFYFNMRVIEGEHGEVIRNIPALLTSDKRVIRLDAIRRKDEQAMLIVDQAFQIPYEIRKAIMTDEGCSLTHSHALKYKAGNIQKADVTPSKLVRELEKYIREIYYTDDETIYKVIALYIYSTYFYQLFGETAYLHITGEKGTGKSLICRILELFCFCSKYVVAASEAAIFRCISCEGGTFILDEMENIGSREKANDSMMATILKAGYNRGCGQTIRCNTEDGTVERFCLYSPKIIANIFGIDDVVSDRCIKIPVKKFASDLTKDKLNIKIFEYENKHNFKEFTSNCCLSALLYFEEVFEAFKTVEFSAESSRTTQILRPLAVLAEFVGTDYKEALNQYYKECIAKDKAWIKTNTPEGIMKEVLMDVAKEIKGTTNALLNEDNHIQRNYFGKIDGEEFMINTLALKILFDMRDGKKNYNISEINKILDRLFPRILVDRADRTTVSFKNNDFLVKTLNRTALSIHKVRFRFDEFLDQDEFIKNAEAKKPFPKTEEEKEPELF